jgi:phosphatidylglycerol:prolipoprotein diacylglycerol transferase
MLPYFEQPAWHVGPLTIHAFGIAVAAAIWVGLTMVERRFRQAALDPAIGRHLGGWILIAGVLGAHLFSVLFYFPDQLREDPWLLLRIWEPIASLGGILGGITGAALFFAIRGRRVDAPTRLAYLDAIAFVFPIGLAIGRFGCALAHDHPGVVTTFPLAVSLESPAARAYLRSVYDAAALALPPAAATMGFHDLGLYECVFLALIIVPAFRYWNRRRQAPGFYIVAFFTMYLPVRFALDALRVSDARYLRLTPAQWVAAFILAALPLRALGQGKVRFAISGAVILATAWACWGGPR